MNKEQMMEIIAALCLHSKNLQRIWNYNTLYINYLDRLKDEPDNIAEIDKWFDDEIDSNQDEYVVPLPEFEISDKKTLMKIFGIMDILGFKYIDDLVDFGVKCDKYSMIEEVENGLA